MIYRFRDFKNMVLSLDTIVGELMDARYNAKKAKKAPAEHRIINNPNIRARKSQLRMVTPLPEHFVNNGTVGVPEQETQVIVMAKEAKSLNTSRAIEVISLTNFLNLPLSQRQQQTKELINYLRTVPGMPANSLVKSTGEDIDYITDKTFQKIVASINQAIPPSTYNRTNYRIPTEVCIHWIYILKTALLNNKRYSKRQEDVIKKIINNQKSRWMRHDLTVPSMKASLISDSEALLKIGLEKLANVAYSPLGEESLQSQLPQKDDYKLIAARLSDNMYGEVFDSVWVKNMVEVQKPKSLYNTMYRVGQGIIKMLKNLNTPELRQIFMQELLEKFTESAPRPWHQSLKFWKPLISQNNMDDAWKKLHDVLNKPVSNGTEVILMAYLSSKSYISLQKTLLQKGLPSSDWVVRTNKNTSKNINVHRVRNATNTITPLSSPPPRSGIVAPFRPTTGDLPGDITSRPSTGRRTLFPGERSPNNGNFKADTIDPNTGKISQFMFEHGLSYTGGLSGTINMIMGAILEFSRTDKTINLLDAAIGAIMFVVYDGGHNIHEALWALYQRKIPGLELTTVKGTQDELFLSDYEQFIKAYKSLPDTQMALNKSFDVAWKETLKYFNQHSYYANLFVGA